MSKTIDEKVVEMKFDNKDFENNVKTSMSTLDKLKAKLDLKGASKGLENIKTTSEKINMSGMSTALETVHAKFSALEVIGVTALANITNSAVNAGKRIVSALTIEPVRTGFQEYELKMDSVRTIMASTGESVETVNKYLNELNEYSDQTIYKFSDMTQNIGKFTNAGVKLEDAVIAMKGLSNEAAVSGANTQEAARAMYNFAQALSMGYVQLIDWKSIENANMATIEFKNNLLKTAVQLGTVKKVGDNLYQAGKESYNLQAMFKDGLKDQWLTTDVLLTTLKDYGDATTEIGKKAYAAAQDVTKFTQMWDVLKETAQSGWAQTWEILVGDINKAKAIFTPLTNFFSDLIQGFDKARNTLLQSALGKNFKSLAENVKNVLGPIKETADSVKTVVNEMKDYTKVVDDIILGKYKNAPERFQLLAEAGYDWAHAQNLVNERLGCSFRYEDKYQESQEQRVETQEQLNESTMNMIANLASLSEAELRAKGYTDEQINALKELAKVAEKTGIPLKELLEHIDEIDGRWLLVNALKNSGKSLVEIFKALGQAWRDVFPPMSADTLFNIIAGFHKLSTEVLGNVTAHSDALKRTLRGLFSILGLISDIVGGGLKVALTVVRGILSVFNMNIFEFTAYIGDAIYYTRQWIKEHDILFKSVQWVTSGIVSLVIALKDFIKNSDVIQGNIQKIKNAFSSIGDSFNAWKEGLKTADNIPKYIFEGLINGLKSGGQKVFDIISNIGKTLIEIFCKILKIASPSKVFFAIGGFIIAGLLGGIMAGKGNLLDGLKNIGNAIINFFKGIKIGDVISIAISAGLIYTVNKILKLFQSIVSPLKGLNNMFNGLAGMFTDFGNAAENWGKKQKYEGIASIIKSIAASIAVLAAAMVVLGKLPREELIQGSIALGGLILVLSAFMGVVALMSKRLSKVKIPDMGKIFALTLGISAAMWILSKALKSISKIEPDRMLPSLLGLAGCAAALGILVLAFAKLTGSINKKSVDEKNIKKLTKIFTKIGTAMLLMSLALRLMSGVKKEGIIRMVEVFTAIGLLLFAIAALNKWSAGSITNACETIKAVSTSLLLLVIAMKLSGGLKSEDFKNGIKVIGVFLLMLTALMGISKLFKSTEMIKVSGSILLIIAAIGMLALVMRICNTMDEAALKKGLVCIGALSAIIGVLIAVSKNSKSLHGTTLVGVAACIIALSAATVLLGLMDPDKIQNGLKAVGALSLFTALLVKATSGFKAAEGTSKTLITLTVMLSLLAIAMVGLSFIQPEKLLSSASALGMVMISLSAVVAAVGHMKISKKTVSTLLFLTLVIGALAGIISLLSGLPNVSGATSAAAAISILLGTMALVSVALNKFDQRKKINIKGIAQLGAVLLVIAGIAGVLALMGNIQNAIQNAGALSILLGVMTIALAAISAIGQFLSAGVLTGVLGLAGIAASLLLVVASLTLMDGLQNATENAKALGMLLGVMAIALTAISLVGNLVTGVIAGVAGLIVVATSLFILVGVLATMQNIQNAIPNAIALGILLTAMSDALFKLSLVGPLLLIVDAALLGLIGIMGTIGVLATAIGGIMTAFPQLKEFLDKGMVVLADIANGIGVILGKLVSGFMSASTEGLPEIGTRLSMFMINALPFITIAKTIDDSLGKGVSALSGALFALIGANVLDAISQFITKGESFSRLGSELSNFAINAMPFIALMNTVKPESMQGAKNMADAILALTGGNLLDSITKWFSGDKDLAAFGNQLAPLASGLSSFVNNITFGEDSINIINCACEALKKLSETAKEIPGSDGLWQWISGDTDIKGFGEKLPILAEGLVAFVTKLTEGQFSDDKINIVNCACEALKKLAEVAKAIPKQDGFWQWLSGDQDLKKFGEKLPDLADGICKFVNKLVEGGLSKDKVDVVNSAVGVLTVVKDLANIDANSLSDKVGGLGDNLSKLGTKLKEFSDSLNNLKSEDLVSAKDKLNQIIDLCNTIVSVNSEALNSFSDTLSKFGTEAIQSFVNSLNDTQPREDAANAIRAIIDKLLQAADEKKPEIENKCKDLVNAAGSALQDSGAVSKAQEAGKNFAQGFANGINWNSDSASSAGRSLGNKAYEAAKKAIDSHSPSKKTYKLGKFFDEGFVNGIKALQDRVYSSSYNVGEQAKTGLAKAISKISNILESDMDANPTIRPVLDLDDVKSGIDSIGSMFGQPNLAVATNLGAISYGMRTNRQNGNQDVVSAIDKLRDNLGKQGDSYNINGITYDDGSEVASAIKTLVRAVKVEGRK